MTTSRLIGGWAGRRLADGQGATDGKTRRSRRRPHDGNRAGEADDGGAAGDTNGGGVAGQDGGADRVTTSRLIGGWQGDGWRMDRARRMARRDGQGAVYGTATGLAWRMTAALQEIPMAAASQDKTAALEGGGA